eukprot:CAMPEP_0170629188 /NCGR_PEP_ID=MMETSP0224-20130122/33184_1 /TAXON_ID=285029 /ORGANISM="Togula jolla, Strain CCCM 725" /LENGTH=82 /DNA_ID=CAMNT_0010956863 /DNA_START=36 /DNA_END=280 /DNA_ORIENTATION=+
MHSKEPLHIVPAEVQGYEQNLIHHAKKFSEHQHSLPFFLDPSPARPTEVQRSAARRSAPSPDQTAPGSGAQHFCPACHEGRL